jgi:hypothetical protein
MPTHRVYDHRGWKPGVSKRLEDFVDRRYRSKA